MNLECNIREGEKIAICFVLLVTIGCGCYLLNEKIRINSEYKQAKMSGKYS